MQLLHRALQVFRICCCGTVEKQYGWIIYSCVCNTDVCQGRKVFTPGDYMFKVLIPKWQHVSTCLQFFSTVLAPSNPLINIWEYHRLHLFMEATVKKKKEIKKYRALPELPCADECLSHFQSICQGISKAHGIFTFPSPDLHSFQYKQTHFFLRGKYRHWNRGILQIEQKASACPEITCRPKNWGY